MTSPDSKFFVPVERRRELMEHHVTLNGKQAVISGALNDFATVSVLPDGTERADFAWWTVEHVIYHSNGEFNA